MPIVIPKIGEHVAFRVCVADQDKEACAEGGVVEEYAVGMTGKEVFYIVRLTKTGRTSVFPLECLEVSV